MSPISGVTKNKLLKFYIFLVNKLTVCDKKSLSFTVMYMYRAILYPIFRQLIAISRDTHTFSLSVTV